VLQGCPEIDGGVRSAGSIEWGLNDRVISLKSSDISSIDHLIMREFVSGPPRYHLAIKGVRFE